MSAPLNELRLDVGMPLHEVVRRTQDWARAVVARLTGDAASEVVSLRNVSPEQLPVECTVQSRRPPQSVLLRSARTNVAGTPFLSGGEVSWTPRAGAVRIETIAALSSSTTYDVELEVRF